MFTGDIRGFFYCHLMSPNVTHATRCHATAKKTDLEVFEPTMWEKEARHIGGQEIKTATLFNA